MNIRKRSACAIKLIAIVYFLWLANMIAFGQRPERPSEIYARLAAEGSAPPPYGTPTPIPTPTPDRFCQSITSL